MPVLQVSFRAAPSGYTLLSTRRLLGKPTLAFDPTHDVRVTARDGEGHEVALMSVPNPRTAYACEEEDRGEFQLAEGLLILRFPYPDQIRQLDLLVLRGPNEALHQVFTVD